MQVFDTFSNFISTLSKLPKKQRPSHVMIGFFKAHAGPHDEEEAIQIDDIDGEAGNLVPVGFCHLIFAKSLELKDILAKQPPLPVDWTYFYAIGAIPKGDPSPETVTEIVLQQMDRAADLNFDPDAGLALFDRNGIRVLEIRWPKAASAMVH